jgi:hypothetical protein
MYDKCLFKVNVLNQVIDGGTVMFNDETKKWYSLPKQIREKLKGNVFCSNCGVTTITEFVVKPADPHIVLEGKCVSCNDDVARLIEF